MHTCVGEGNGNPLQYSCLENPRDGGAWWAAVYGVTQSRTRLKQLSSSSISLPAAAVVSWLRLLQWRNRLEHPEPGAGSEAAAWFNLELRPLAPIPPTSRPVRVRRSCSSRGSSRSSLEMTRRSVAQNSSTFSTESWSDVLKTDGLGIDPCPSMVVAWL